MSLYESYKNGIKFKILEGVMGGRIRDDQTESWLNVIKDIETKKKIVVWCFESLNFQLCEPYRYRKNAKYCLHCKEFINPHITIYDDGHFHIPSVEEYFSLIEEAVKNGYLEVEFEK